MKTNLNENLQNADLGGGWGAVGVSLFVHILNSTDILRVRYITLKFNYDLISALIDNETRNYQSRSQPKLTNPGPGQN